MSIKSIRYINLDHNIGRGLIAKAFLSRFPYLSIRCPGVIYDECSEDHARYTRNGFDSYMLSLDGRKTRGIIGCWIAHIKALENITDRDGLTVIIEDDFICGRNFFDRAINMITEFERDFDVILFDAFGDVIRKDHEIFPNIYDPKGTSFPHYIGSHCLFINNKNIPQLLYGLTNNPIKDYDGCLLSNELIKSYVFHTGLSTQIYIGTEVEGKGGWMTFLRGLFKRIKFSL